MPPTIVAVGTVASGVGTITPTFPAGIQADDILIGVGETTGGSNFPTIATNTFAHLASDSTAVSPVVQGLNTQLSVVWARYDGVITAHAWGDSGDHNIGRYIALRGCPTTGNPWHVVAVATSATSSTSASWPGVTTTVADCLILEIIATGTDIASTAQLGTLTNGSYTSIVEQMDNWTSSGSGGGIGCVSATLAAAGASGSSTATLATAATKAYATVAWAAAAGGGGVAPQIILRSPRPAERPNLVGPYAPPGPPSTIIPGD